MPSSIYTNSSRQAVYASDPQIIRGRLHAEEESIGRTPFQRDRDRIIHCAAFRRLEHKTQVFVHHEGDNYRSRLTHSLEVAQIARSVSRELGLNEDLAEALALAHDLGHTPFGHAGEDALDEAMREYGGFSHNAQTLRIVTLLERRYAAFDGLNLTWETLEGVVKHNGPVTLDSPQKPIADYCALHDLELATYPSLEAQVAAICDDIAYNNHDIDDALRAGLFSIDALREVPLVARVLESIELQHPNLELQRLIHEMVRRLIHHMVTDLLSETRRRIETLNPKCVADVRSFEIPLAAFSEEMQQSDGMLRAFLFDNMYRHYRVNRMASKARRVVTEIFALFLDEPECLPTEWRCRAQSPRSDQTARVVCDYVAGMTDRFALDEYARLFNVAATNK